MNTPDPYTLTWHEDDELHQAEGALSARLGVTVDEALRAIRAHSADTGTPVRELATGIVKDGVVVEPRAR
jgi:AmiR/NasT family two-component response regulator